MSRFYILALCLCIMAVFCSCAAENEQVAEHGFNGGSLRNTVLYYSTDSGYVIPVMRQIPWEEGIACAALSYLVATEDNAAEAARCGLRTVIPDGTKFALKIDDKKHAVLDVQNMPDLKNAEAEKIFLQSVVNTLTEFDTIDTVSITFDGEYEARLHHGTDVEENMYSFLLNPMSIDMETMTTGGINSMVFYTPDSTCLYNLPITGYSENDKSFSEAMKLFCEYSATHTNGLPYGTSVISAQITDDGVASVKFTEEFGDVSTMGDGILDAVYNAIYLTAKEYGDVKELKLYAEDYEMDCSACSVSAPMYVNEWMTTYD